MSIFDVREFTSYTKNVLLTQLIAKIIVQLDGNSAKIEQLRTILEETAAFSHDNNTNLEVDIMKVLCKYCVDHNLTSCCSICFSEGYTGHSHLCHP